MNVRSGFADACTITFVLCPTMQSLILTLVLTDTMSVQQQIVIISSELCDFTHTYMELYYENLMLQYNYIHACTVGVQKKVSILLSSTEYGT